MNVIETVKDILSNSDILDEFNGVHVDYTESVPGAAGLFSNGASKIGEDLIGNIRYRINLTLYTGLTAAIDYDRLNNSDLLLKLTYYLNTLKGITTSETVDGVEYQAEITRMSCSNGILYSVPTGDANDGVQYQLQLQVEYIIYTEE